MSTPFDVVKAAVRFVRATESQNCQRAHEVAAYQALKEAVAGLDLGRAQALKRAAGPVDDVSGEDSAVVSIRLKAAEAERRARQLDGDALRTVDAAERKTLEERAAEAWAEARRWFELFSDTEEGEL